jgi:hypothetical protein
MGLRQLFVDAAQLKVCGIMGQATLDVVSTEVMARFRRHAFAN